MNILKKSSFALSVTATALAALMASSAIAQTPSTAPAKAPATAAARPASKPVSRPATRAVAKPVAKTKHTQAPRTAKSLACSKQADSKSLHGKPRKSFMEKCKKA